MKKIAILAAAAALVLASCAKNEVVSTTLEQIPIGFSNYSPRSLTKAAEANYVSGTTLVNDATFAVYAWSYANDATFDATVAPNFMKPVVVTYAGDTEDGDANTYSPLRYWPAGDTPDKLAFIAYYPENGAGITPPTENGLGEYSFTAQTTDAAMVDFLVADLVPDQTYGNTNASPTYKGTVKFTFRHQLTRVGFKFKKTDVPAEIKVTSAKLYNIKYTGDLTVAYGTSGTTTTWDNQDGAATYTVNIPTDALTTSAAPATVAPENLFLMVPQDMEANDSTAPQYLEITWTVTVDGVTTTNTKKLYLDDVLNSDADDATAANIDWAKNMSVTYTITIGPKPIWFTAEVGNWLDETEGYFNVQ